MKQYRKYFRQALQNHFPGQVDSLVAEVESNFQTISQDTRFARRSKNPIDRRLDMAAYFLALIKVLDERGEAYGRIHQICHEVAIDFVRPKNRWQAWLKKLPPKLIGTQFANVLLRILNKKFSTSAHPDGFIANIITAKEETYGFGYGFDIIECGICKLFKKHHYEQYVPILCEVDKITSGLAGLKLIRTSTIGYGAKTCDFRFVKED